MKSMSWQFDAYGTPSEVLRFREQTLPEPGPGQALVKIRAIGMNLSDLNTVAGQHFPNQQFPSCLGGEAVGEIIALGPQVDGGPATVDRLKLEVGMRVGTISVLTNSTEMGVFRDVGLYDQAGLAPIPQSYSDEEGAALWTAVLTMAGAMEMGGFTAANASGQRVLVTAGASGMGVVALKLAKHWGAATIATTRNPDKADALGELADHVVVCSDSAKLVEGLEHATGGEGFDLALDPVGAALYPGLLAAAGRGASIVSYEAITGSDASVPIMEMMMKDASFHGFTIFRTIGSPLLLNQLIDVGMDNAEAIRPIISQTFDLAETPAALEQLGRSEHLGKIIVKC